MDYQINFENFRTNFSLPAAIAEDLANVRSDYLKIILLIFRNPDKDYSVNLLTNLLNLPEQTVRDGLYYWISRGVLTSKTVKAKENTVQPTVIATKEIKAPVHQNDRELKFLLDSLESVLKRPVTSSDLKTISYIYDYYRLPADVILMAVQYSVDQGKNSIKYIESVCIHWYQEGITTYTAVEEYLLQAKNRRDHENQVKQIFGIAGRKLIASEEKFIRTWFEDYHFDASVIQLAFERTIKNTGKIAFAYTNRILQNWFEKGLHTVDQIQAKEPSALRKPSANLESSYDLQVLDSYLDRKPTLKD